ncbi:uncharacterized protein LOC112569239 [Pomacea canaliculata]|uniref:uncharacterized protein LOC112569239 n=1 Tax=Pomacea canaliculata TaxID=400727 RepID=UPI000D73EEF6|nr:uncharacterized protein LOC112569239 [Pomacea canaliculata]
MGNTFCFMVLLLLFPESGQSSTIACTSRDEELSYDRSVLAENTFANFTYQLKSMANIEKSDYRIEIKLCDIGTLYESCRCRWFLNSDPVCRSMKNDSFCDADESEMRVSLLIRRTYTDVLWVLLKQSSPPSVLKHTTVQVTYQAKITDLYLNGQEANGTHIVDENEDVNISCFFINGNPPVSIRMVDGTGHTLSSVRHGQGPLTLSLGVVHCHNVWPTIRCEAPGSELNKSVVILVICRPQLSYISKQVTDVQKVLTEGLTLAMRSYTRNIRKCLMTQVQPITSTREVKCEVSGHAPVSN